MISDLYVHTISVEPLEVSATTKQRYGTAFDVVCRIESLDTDDALQADGIFRFYYRGYADISTTLNEGDRVTFDGDTFIVKAITKFRIPNRDIAHVKFMLAQLKDG